MYNLSFFSVFDMGLGSRNQRTKYWRPLNELFPDIISTSNIIHDKFLISYYYANNKIQNNLKEFLGMNKTNTLFIDSGGYQAKSNKIQITTKNALSVLQYQENNGADIAATLDFPFDYNETSVWEGWRRIKISIKCAQLALRNKNNHNMKLYAAIHGWDVLSFKKIASLLAEDDFDGFAIGLPNIRHGFLSSSMYLLKVSKILYEVKKIIQDKPIHVFGLSNMPIIFLFAYFGIASFDSLKYLHAAKYREYFLPNGKMSFLGRRKSGRKITELPCLCPVCKNVDAEYLSKNGSLQGALVATHNLITLLNQIKMINSSINENWFGELFDNAYYLYPNLQKSIDWIRKTTIREA